MTLYPVSGRVTFGYGLGGAGGMYGLHGSSTQGAGAVAGAGTTGVIISLDPSHTVLYDQSQ